LRIVEELSKKKQSFKNFGLPFSRGVGGIFSSFSTPKALSK
jgi:hypothetical protein